MAKVLPAIDERALVKLAKDSIMDVEQVATEGEKKESIWNVLAVRAIRDADRQEVRRVGRLVLKMSSVPRTFLEAQGLARLGDMWNAGVIEPYVHTVMRHETAMAYITAFHDECQQVMIKQAWTEVTNAS